ncbi:MAG: hypothetical protein IJ494_06740 [Bacteroides sp.]|nr:hypothetical protein [Bacteroides sp.]
MRQTNIAVIFWTENGILSASTPILSGFDKAFRHLEHSLLPMAHWSEQSGSPE